MVSICVNLCLKCLRHFTILTKTQRFSGYTKPKQRSALEDCIEIPLRHLGLFLEHFGVIQNKVGNTKTSLQAPKKDSSTFSFKSIVKNKNGQDSVEMPRPLYSFFGRDVTAYFLAACSSRRRAMISSASLFGTAA